MKWSLKVSLEFVRRSSAASQRSTSSISIFLKMLPFTGLPGHIAQPDGDKHGITVWTVNILTYRTLMGNHAVPPQGKSMISQVCP